MYTSHNHIVALLRGAFLLIAVMALDAYAIPADPRPRTFVQPDGSSITYYVRGDEHHHICLSDDGYLLSQKDDRMYYADVDANGNVVASNLLAHSAEKRNANERSFLSRIDMPTVLQRLSQRALSAPRRTPAMAGDIKPIDAPYTPGLFSGTHFPVVGEQRALVILVEYTDTKFKLSDPYDYFSRLLMEEGFDDYGATGSAHDYFIENSDGQFDPQFDLFGPITLSQKMSYYGGNDWSGSDQRAYEMVIEACNQLDETIDFSQYDRDGDGYIDNVFVYYAGQGEASYGGSNTVWPHAWEIEAATSTPYYYDGVKLNRYACSNEWELNRPDGVGTFVHEFSHVMGLPDLYATSYTSAFTPGSWSAMDAGPYNNDGMTPPNYGAFERCALGWMTPKVFDGPAHIELTNIVNNDAYYIPTEKSNEYFLIENRQQEGWDAYIPGHGMLVWHIDYNSSVWYNNTVNNRASHQYVDIVEADGTESEYSRAGDAFPGTSNVTSFTSTTSPAMKSWAGKACGLPLTQITEADGIISFDVDGGLFNLSQVVAHEAVDVTATSFKFTWDKDPDATSYLVSVYTKDDAGAPVYVEGWERRDVAAQLSITVTGLMPETTYYYIVESARSGKTGEPSDELSVVTGDKPLSMRAPVALEATQICYDSFMAAWEPVKYANRYTLSVYTKEPGTQQTLVCGFNETGNPLPEGWTASSITTFRNTTYCGVSAPSLCLSKDDDYVCSPDVPNGVVSLSFWHRGSLNPQSNRLIIQAVVGGEIVEVAQCEICQDEGGQTLEFDEFPVGTTAVRIAYYNPSKRASVAIDDIVVVSGYSQTLIPVEGYLAYDAGANTSVLVEGLNAMTEYYYTVTALNDQEISLTSNEIMVTTTEYVDGIVDASAADVMLSVNAGTVTVTAAAGTDISVYDTVGRLVGRATADSRGHATLRLPGRAVYVVRVGARQFKVRPL